jgi:acyl carrier protein
MDIEKTIKEFIISEIMHEKRISSLKNDEPLLEKGIIDSVGLLHLLTFIEERFNVQIPDEEVIPENFETLNKIASFIKKKQGLP